MSYKNVKFDNSKVDKALYEDPYGSSYPTIVWHGKYSGNGSEAGYWTLDRLESDKAPGPYWEEAEVRFGSSPEAPLTAVWKSERLRACVLGIRKRILIYGEDGGHYTYPWLTPKNESVPGKYKAHFQIAVCLPDTEDKIFQIALKGVAKTKAWGNPEGGRYHDPKFPKGAELMLRDLAAYAGKEAGAEFPEYCTFWLDLIPFTNDKGKPVYIDMGYGTHVVAFTADTSSGKKVGLEHRFVGLETFEIFQDIRGNEILEWEDSWSKESGDSAEEVDLYKEPEEDDPLNPIPSVKADKVAY